MERGLCLYSYSYLFSYPGEAKEGRYQYAGWLYAALVILKGMIEERQSCKSNAALLTKQDATSIEKTPLNYTKT